MPTFAALALLVLAQGDEPAIRILKEAMAKQDDPAALALALSAIDEETQKNPKAPNNHYARGYILSRLKRGDEAVAAYGEATRLKPDFADAFYNAGVVLSRLGRLEEAAARYDAASAADPGHVDASTTRARPTTAGRTSGRRSTAGRRRAP